MRPLRLAERPAGWAFTVDVAAVLAVWGAAVLAEDVALGFLWREQFSGPWEIALARHVVAPIALLALVPASVAAVVGFRLAVRAAHGSRAATAWLTAIGVLAGFVFALGISQGRHFASLWVRGPFVFALGAAGGMVGRWVVPRIAGLERRPVLLLTLGLALAVGSWFADAFVLPRLYPAFHATMGAACLLGSALAALAGRAGAPAPGPVALAGASIVGLAVSACAAAAPRASRALQRATNLRIVLVEHAPLMGRAVTLAMSLRPPDSEKDTSAPVSGMAAPGEVVRSLDWTGHDLVLLTVDALRADHVSSYGYGRQTTPNLDALAAEGTRFDSAYCPTPHTSYSLTSMMTGKYLRPLLALGLGEDSETWAQLLRRYGWRTGAFYPPAVFFIDEDRFPRFKQEHLGFEYAKVEFADPALREQQVAAYLASAPADRPLFLWVHFFEPHEPYVVHPDHVFTGGPSADVDAYDSEVAEADDGIGRIVRLVRARRPGSAFVVTADHGEEFGEHGGRYHGTTVYDEQVRVPLVVVGPGVRATGRVGAVVQTIDLLPTALSALGIPRPARLRGRDLGALLSGAGKGLADDDGRAFVETDAYELIASGAERLICQRQAAACALYRPKDDPLERRDVSADAPQRFEQMRAFLRETARDHGRYEAAGTSAWPEPIRRGLLGEAEAAPDVASLLEDADVAIRRKAAEVSFGLHATATAPEVKRALVRDEDDEVRRWSALALARMGEAVPPLAEALLRDADRDWRRRAALALGERGDARGCEEMTAWWSDALAVAEVGGDGEPLRLSIDLPHTREWLSATAKARCHAAVPALLRALEDVRARPYVADALGALLDDRARGPLLGMLAVEPYLTTRPREARALLALGVHDWSSAEPAAEVHTRLAAPSGPSRLVVLLSDAYADLTVQAEGVTEGAAAHEADGEVRIVELEPHGRNRRLSFDLRTSTGGIIALWLVPETGRLD